jgi:predicted dehydrogenase
MKRRVFMKKVSAGIGVAALSASWAGTKVMGAVKPGKKLGFALVGLGSLSTHQIAPALQKTKFCRLAGVVTGTPSKAAEWKVKYGIPEKNIYNYQNFDKIAENPDIDVVYVVLPNAMHGEFTIRAAKAGKHVLCEKPMEVSVEKCQEMIDACRKAKRQLAVGYRCHFIPFHQELMRFSREKTFGAIKMIEAGFGFKIGDPTQWRLRKSLAGGGALMDVGIYALQAARYVAGEEPIELCAVETKTDREKFREVDETILWWMRFPGGIVANCETSYNCNGFDNVRASAEEGWFRLDPAYIYNGVKGETSKGPMNFPQTDHFADEMDDFAECILNNKPTRVPGEEGLRDVRIMMAIYESIATGRPVKLA